MSTTPDNQQPVPPQSAQAPPVQPPATQEPVRWEPAPQAHVPPQNPVQHVPEQQTPVHPSPVQQAPAPQVPLQPTPVQQESVHYTQPTTPLPEFAQAGAGGEFSPEAPKSKNGGGLVAGLLVGALVGALVGGGTAAVVAHNVGGQTVVQGTQGGSLTLNNLDSATAITGVAAVATPSVVTLQVFDGSVGGSGSGVIYSEDGYIITNAHVATLEGATSDPDITVQTSDGVLYDGTLVGSDPFADIAVVKIDAEGLTPVAIADSDKINVGDLAVVIGAPLNLSNTVTSGVVSALDRGISVASSMVGEDDGGPEQQEGPLPWFQFETPNEQQQQSSAPASRVAIPVIQTDASINPGNSGGALLNANAELIGINVALASPTASSGAAGSDGLGFAVPVNLAVRVADALIAGERPSHGLIGVTQTAESSTANRAGGVIGEVTPGSPADKGGLRAGDVITSINGRLADSFTTVTALVRMHEGGEEITIGYNRNGEQRETTVVLDTLEW